MEGMSAQQVIDLLDLKPHPEGGYYKETFRDQSNASTAIYYMLEAGDRSHWHRVHGSSEVWHHYSGGILELTLSEDGNDAETHRLGKNVATGERPQIIVPPGWWPDGRKSRRVDLSWMHCGARIYIRQF